MSRLKTLEAAFSSSTCATRHPNLELKKKEKPIKTCNGYGEFLRSNNQLRHCLLIYLFQTQPTLILTMFSKLALFFAAIMAVFVVALPRPGGESGITNSCDGGQDYCCMSSSSFFKNA